MASSAARKPDAAGDTEIPLIKADPWLAPFRDKLVERERRLGSRLQSFAESGGLLGEISQGHRFYGLNRGLESGEPGVWYREWAPGARSLRLAGDFNGWNRESHPLQRDEFGRWSIFVPDHGAKLAHGSLLKVHVVGADGAARDRIPAYIRRAVQGSDHDFSGQYWEPEHAYEFRHARPGAFPGEGLRIYEAHVGMAQEEARVGLYREFRERVLPHIARLGYNAIQLMAIQEHPYYGSFGYHVSSLFAPSSRFGTPEELKELVDEAHALGIRVLLDIVHSHAVKNTLEGLNRFDGTDFQYFHAGPRGTHVAWDSMVYDYSKFEVQKLLLSNVRYWLEEFRFDGFRFDGVTSMLYLDHGLGKRFTRYDEYFDPGVDEDAVTYLKTANLLAHELVPSAITIAEDVSGMPGMARPVREGGMGFDYRLAMGIPDQWIKLLKEQTDEEWNLGQIFSTSLHRRRDEKHIGYAESHDQALVGDKTLAFRLMDQEMYWHMSRLTESPVVDRGIALHKLIRLITFSLAGEGWLSFMGNEFGHPEWIDFPREGNQFSYQHARRQWSLSRREDLRYKGLLDFDGALMALDRDFGLLEERAIDQLALHEDSRQLIYRRGPLVFAFNFHPSHSPFGLRIPIPEARDYRIVLDTDEPRFGGFGRNEPGARFPWQDVAMYGRPQSLQLYLPSRTAVVLAPI